MCDLMTLQCVITVHITQLTAFLCSAHSDRYCDYCCDQVNLADFTDNHWVTCFQETAEQILGKKADELGELKDNVSHGSFVHI